MRGGSIRNLRVFLRLRSGDFDGVVSKRALEITKPVFAKLRAVAEEERAAHKAGVEKFAQQRRGDARLARARG